MTNIINNIETFFKNRPIEISDQEYEMAAAAITCALATKGIIIPMPIVAKTLKFLVKSIEAEMDCE